MAEKPDTTDDASWAPTPEKGTMEATHLHSESLVKRYSPFSVMALAFTTMNSWVAFGSGLAIPLACGAGPGLIYGLIAAAVVMGTIDVGFAELASAFPSAGGQYHIVFMVFPPKTRHVAAFFTAWISIIYIMAALLSCNFFVASSILDLVNLWIDTYEIQAWHTYLLHILLCVIACALTSRFPAAIGRLGMTMFWLSLVGFVASLATLLSVNKEKQSSSFVFKEYTNESGWSEGWAVFIGITACLWSFSGVDGPTHLSEEVSNPSRTVPKAIFVTLILNAITVLAWNIALMYVVKDVDAIIGSTVPILEVYNQALGNRVATTVWSVYYMIMFYVIVLNLFTFAGRTIWSLARDGGMPFSKFLTHLDWASPVRASIVMLGLQVLVGILYIISTTAYSSFINLTVFALNITVVLPQAALLFRGRGCLPERAFSLGKFGYAVNAVATVFMVFFSVTFCFPAFMPITASSMNYLIVVMATGLVFTACLWWGGFKRTFTGPQVVIAPEE